MTHPVVRKMIEEAAEKNSLSGCAQIEMTKEYDEECFHFLDDFKDEIFENSDLSYFISKVLEHLPINHNDEIYNLYTEEYPIENNPEMYLWTINGTTLSLDEISDELVNNPLYNPEKQNVSDFGTPVFDADTLSEFINDSVYSLSSIVSWDVQRHDFKRGLATVTASLELTIDQIMDLPDYALSGWNYSVPVSQGTLTIEG